MVEIGVGLSQGLQVAWSSAAGPGALPYQVSRVPKSHDPSLTLYTMN